MTSKHKKIEEMGLTQFEYLHSEQSTSEQQSRRRRYLLMAGIFGVVLVISAVIIAVIAITFQEETKCMNNLKCLHIKDCEGQHTDVDITFPCDEHKICCIPKLSTRNEIVNAKTKAERLRKRTLLMSDCGILPLSDKLANGEDTNLGDYPWMAILGYSAAVSSSESIMEFKCGGTLISDQHILTAAHCIHKSLTAVYLGTVNLTSVKLNTTECHIFDDGSETCVYPTKFTVVNITIHPQYNASSKNYKNDIAILKLHRKVREEEEFIKKICLPFELNVAERLGWKNFTFSMTGWGLIEHHGDVYHILQEVKKVVSWRYDSCTDYLANSQNLLPITRKQLCATGQNYSEACKGDSGGPLSHTYNVATQVGIISFKPLDTCGTVQQPTIFTRVDGYLDWILDSMDI